MAFFVINTAYSMGLHELQKVLTGLQQSGDGFTVPLLAAQSEVPEGDVQQALTRVGGIRYGVDPVTNQKVMYLEENASIPKEFHLKAGNGIKAFGRSVIPGFPIAEPEHKPLKPK